jgi:hypothetical protein
VAATFKSRVTQPDALRLQKPVLSTISK